MDIWKKQFVTGSARQSIALLLQDKGSCFWPPAYTCLYVRCSSNNFTWVRQRQQNTPTQIGLVWTVKINVKLTHRATHCATVPALQHYYHSASLFIFSSSIEVNWISLHCLPNGRDEEKLCYVICRNMTTPPYCGAHCQRRPFPKLMAAAACVVCLAFNWTPPKESPKKPYKKTKVPSTMDPWETPLHLQNRCTCQGSMKAL